MPLSRQLEKITRVSGGDFALFPFVRFAFARTLVVIDSQSFFLSFLGALESDGRQKE